MSAASSAPLLEFAAARLPLPEQAGAGLAIDFTLRRGDLVLVHPGDEQHERLLTDGACGLMPPKEGTIRFLGHAWPDLPADRANALRGRIGHVFRRGAWISYLTLLDNVLLPQRQHTRRPDVELRDEAARLARWFGLPGLPVGLPAEIAPPDLQRAGYVRAFLGSPALIVLEGATGIRGDGLLPALINAMRAARDRGAAILWFAQDRDVFHDPTLPVTRRLQLRGHAIVAEGST